ncbi:twin-arginine translocase subunit TatB [Rhodanobacter sp. 7MK24]|uniref:Sec-independent protein translocase protein TatB n=1 Tax=Rhodanobacter sp. 7MK24 TaxID=2775922 RepID=UPI00177F6F69|nr:Sec-independent protein translocase protein TatB [Rhodanobacter sp. 7MK24]MBD8879857.1 twin-arginine translocase subunit TatB [Rhodanobacter sp. 7MK24]
MIEISFGKLVLLALVALIVLGPEKLPGAARTAGALLRRVRNGWDSVRAEVERELEVEEIKRVAREAAARAEAAQSELEESVQQVRQPMEEAAETLKSAAAPVSLPTTEEIPPQAQASLPLGDPPAAVEAKEPAHGGH